MLAAFITALPGIIAFFGSLMAARGEASKERKEVVKDANQLIVQGVADRDPSALTLGNDRLGGL